LCQQHIGGQDLLDRHVHFVTRASMCLRARAYFGAVVDTWAITAAGTALTDATDAPSTG
jgi:hypothetical protein